MEDIFMLISFRFAFVMGRLICLHADENKSTDKLSTGLMKEKIKFSVNSENVFEKPKELLQTKCWKTWLKGLFKMRTLPRFTIWVTAVILQKNSRERAHGQEPMKSFKMGSLMQEHRLRKMKSSMTS